MTHFWPVMLCLLATMTCPARAGDETIEPRSRPVTAVVTVVCCRRACQDAQGIIIHDHVLDHGPLGVASGKVAAVREPALAAVDDPAALDQKILRGTDEDSARVHEDGAADELFAPLNRRAADATDWLLFLLGPTATDPQRTGRFGRFTRGGCRNG
jgi:hypothetical protein